MKKALPESLRVAIVTQKLPLGGLASDYGYLWHLCRHLSSRGHDITVITTDQVSKAASTEGVKVHLVETFLGDLASSLRESVLDRVEQLHLEHPFDIIHSVDHTGLNIAKFKKKLGAVLAVDVKGIQLDHIFGLLGMTEETPRSYISTSFAITAKFLKSFFGDDRRFLKSADGVFVASGQQMEILERYYHIASKRIHIIPFGTDANQFSPAPTKNEVIQKLDIDPETKIILTIAPLISVEETENLLRAFERVVIKKPKTALIIIGDGPKKYELEDKMLNLALASKVHFLGNVPFEQINTYINACDVYVNLYSRSSGFEETVLEAMACCKMVIASEVGTSSHVIENGIDGFILRPTDILALSGLLLQAVSGQINTKAIGELARQKIIKMFDTTRMVDQTIRAYYQILRDSGKYKK